MIMMDKLRAALFLTFLLAFPIALAGDAERRLYKRAKENQDPDAMYQIGMHYHKGTGGYATEPHTALVWIQKAAEQGHTEAQFELGNMYHAGRPQAGGGRAPPDTVKAFQWWSREERDTTQPRNN